VNEVSLKQFRDASAPDRACYQALVLTRRRIEDLYEVQEIEEAMHVRLYQYAGLPIVELLGLKVKSRDIAGAAESVDLQPIRPFWMRLSLRQELGKDLCWRIGATHWSKAVHEPGYFIHPTPTKVSKHLVETLDRASSLEPTATNKAQRDLKSVALGWRRPAHERGRDEDTITRQEACTAIEQLDPQMAIESILSKEWQRQEAPRSRQRREQKPDFCLRTDSVGPLGPAVFTKGRMVQRGAWYVEDES
jgi:hypothetical protein